MGTYARRAKPITERNLRDKVMVVVKGFTEFSQRDINKQDEIARTDPDEEKRKKAKRFVLEMMTYNARALRGDFDTY